ncbi:MAG TPA: ABC transporter ATP-binding protein [Candidatus Sulfotelmatobacter sp.]|nr:ABC transporter ATP-binding protein [Candidatus Sulfotelmatobacter sp.]
MDAYQDRTLTAVAIEVPSTAAPAAPMVAPLVRIEGVTKRFDGVVAVDRVDLTVGRGELFSLLGASGCGKTTLLRLLAGFERADAGRILLDGVDMADVPPYERPVNMMFQSYALFPHMTVAQNVAFGLRQDRVAPPERRRRVAEALELVQLVGFDARRPHQLSGGQRQRVALARSLVKRPKVLLLDEPLAALDRKLREQTRLELVRIQKQVGVTFVMVTHDQEEAMTMSTRVGVMHAGRLVQVGTPAEVYETPASRFVADFVGTANLFEARFVRDDAGRAVLVCPDAGTELMTARALGAAAEAAVYLAVRPEKLRLSRAATGVGANRVAGVVQDVAYLGGLSTYHVRLERGMVLRATAPNLEGRGAAGLGIGERVEVSWSPDAIVVLGE